jgi:hypothetical protein
LACPRKRTPWRRAFGASLPAVGEGLRRGTRVGTHRPSHSLREAASLPRDVTFAGTRWVAVRAVERIVTCPARTPRRRRSLSRILFSRPESGSSSHSSCPRVAPGLERPTRGNGRAIRARPEGRTSLLLGLAPDGVYRASALTSGYGELLPHRFTFAPAVRPGPFTFCGTFPRSLGAAVSGHPALWSPDFPPAPLRERRERLLDLLRRRRRRYPLASSTSARQ